MGEDGFDPKVTQLQQRAAQYRLDEEDVARIVSQSEVLPMMTATSAPKFLASDMIDFHHFPRTALLAKSFFE